MKENESLLERGKKNMVKVDEERIQQLVRGFAVNWKKSIEELNRDVMHFFTNFKNGTAILQVGHFGTGRRQSVNALVVSRAICLSSLKVHSVLG